MKSVTQDWVMKLPLRAQGGLLVALRGCDLTEKRPGQRCPERELIAHLRWCVLNPADPREIDIPSAFFKSAPPEPDTWKPSEFGHYPLHWFSHLMHAYEIVGYMHPEPMVAGRALEIYLRMVHSLHLRIEDYGDLMERLTEDRLANDTVVS
jgi:hypothetical protein